MTETVDIAIIGSGPAGLSAAARAAERGLSHVLLERSARFAETIQKYQRGKFIMATPDVLPLQSPLSFVAGIRENILGTWEKQIAELGIRIRYGAEVSAIGGQKGAFTLTLKNKETVTARHVVLAIGVQGNLRKLSIPGGENTKVQYQLDDPKEYAEEQIVVVGAGDAAIENAVALAEQNNVTLVNRRAEFARAKTGNLNAILRAAETGKLQIAYNAAPAGYEDGALILKTDKGESRVPCERIVARLGADPPRAFVETCGVTFRSKDPGSFPEVNAAYESNVPGLYIVGALAGYPLIKHCINQGFEVVERIVGAPVTPADEPLLAQKFAPALAATGSTPSVEMMLQHIRNTVPLLAPLSTLQLREFMLASDVKTLPHGAVIFNRNDYGDSLFCILAGQVAILLDPQDTTRRVQLSAGQFFGEIGLVSGRRRSATLLADGTASLIEIPRAAALKLIRSVPESKRVLDEAVITRQLQTYLGAGLTREDLASVIATAEIVACDAGADLIREGEMDDSVFLLRSGSVMVKKRIGGKDIVLSYLPAGNIVGEMALLRRAPRSATVTAAVASEAIKINGGAFQTLLDRSPALRDKLTGTVRERALQTARREQDKSAASGIAEFLVSQGIGEATDILLIDESLCIRCDNCEKACAETHDGVSRLNREAGPTFAMVHVPTSCRHCEHPHCMADCPPDAIHRAANGEVFIDDSCIGCGNCERNCPYGVIHMAEERAPKPGLLQWLLFGSGPGPGEAPKKKNGDGHKHAVKCDMCGGIEGGSACVRACPTGAALRVSPENFLNLARGVE